MRRFRAYVGLKGTAIADLRRRYNLHEIVAEGDITAPSVRMSGFADATGWCVHPDFVAVRSADGRFLGTRRTNEHLSCDTAANIDQIYLCGRAVWMCMTAPVLLQNQGAAFEEIEDWVENGERGRRLKVVAPARGLLPARTKILSFDRDGMLRRADLGSFSDEGDWVTVYCSAFQSFAGLTLPTLFRSYRMAAGGQLEKQSPFLDIEIYDAAFS